VHVAEYQVLQTNQTRLTDTTADDLNYDLIEEPRNTYQDIPVEIGIYFEPVGSGQYEEIPTDMTGSPILPQKPGGCDDGRKFKKESCAGIY